MTFWQVKVNCCFLRLGLDIKFHMCRFKYFSAFEMQRLNQIPHFSRIFNWISCKCNWSVEFDLDSAFHMCQIKCTHNVCYVNFFFNYVKWFSFTQNNRLNEQNNSSAFVLKKCKFICPPLLNNNVKWWNADFLFYFKELSPWIYF